MARIHWKSSIKTRSLKTRQYTDPSGESCLIFIDTQKISKEADRIADQVTECAAALLYAHLIQEDPTRLAVEISHMRSYQNHFLFPTIIDAINGLLCCHFVKRRKKPVRRCCMPWSMPPPFRNSTFLARRSILLASPCWNRFLFLVTIGSGARCRIQPHHWQNRSSSLLFMKKKQPFFFTIS